jgi:hypothetical protein
MNVRDLAVELSDWRMYEDDWLNVFKKLSPQAQDELCQAYTQWNNDMRKAVFGEKP